MWLAGYPNPKQKTTEPIGSDYKTTEVAAVQNNSSFFCQFSLLFRVLGIEAISMYVTRAKKLGFESLKGAQATTPIRTSQLCIITMTNHRFACYARAVFIFGHSVDVLVLSTTCNDLFCNCVDDMSIWWQMFNFVFLSLKHWFQFNSRIVKHILQA